jgi:hypothetical protein
VPKAWKEYIESEYSQLGGMDDGIIEDAIKSNG